MSGINDRLPTPLSERLSSASQAIYVRQGREVDIAIGGIPFRLATNEQMPQSVETIQVRKDQFDSEADPGEQSLTGWWRRSQASWIDGAGYVYQENEKVGYGGRSANLTFYDSRGVDVFTPGQFSLLKKMQASTQGAAGLSRLKVYLSGILSIGVSGVGSDGAFWTSPGSASGPFASLHAPVGKTIVDGLVTGAYGTASTFYDVASDGTLYKGLVSSPGTATSWPCGATTPTTRIMWGKSRLWMIGGPKIWNPDTTLAGGTAQNPIFTNPNAGWAYTCMAEGPSSMYFGGHDGNSSSISSITLDASGGVPTLSGAQQTAIFPDGELVQEIAIIAGQYIGIGTNRGFRVGVINSTSGAIQYGPLMIEPSGVNTCSALTTQGRFFVVGFIADAMTIAYRVDTGNPQDGDFFPYAADIDIGAGSFINSLASYTNTRLVASRSTGAAYNQSTTDYVASGYLQTGRIRFHTTEPKLFKYLTAEIAPLQGNIQIDLINDANTTVPVGNITTQSEIFTGKFAINAISTLRYASVKFTLTPAVTPTAAPVIYSYLVRALPAVQPQRLITLPLLCFDKETSHSGQQYGGLSFAEDRLAALQILENFGDTLVLQQFSKTGASGQIVIIESMQYIQTTPPRPDLSNNSGGIILLKLRTAEA